MESTYTPQLLPEKRELETKQVLKKLNRTHRALAELKGMVNSIPNQSILINTLVLQEAKDSSAIENIVTTHDELFQASVMHSEQIKNLNAKEVQDYSAALKRGFELVKEREIISVNDIIEIQTVLEKNSAGLRRLPGTSLKNSETKEVVYLPPQDYQVIVKLMVNLETYINDDSLEDYDELVKVAIIHFQFESIHPFYDGNGRTGRILIILYLVLKGLLGLPILYLSRFIISNKGSYYRLLQDVRDKDSWEDWILFILEGIESVAKSTIDLIEKMKSLMANFKEKMREETSFYRKELLENLFKHPYTKIQFVMEDLDVSRITATTYLKKLCELGMLSKIKVGRSNYYINSSLFEVLSSIESV